MAFGKSTRFMENIFFSMRRKQVRISVKHVGLQITGHLLQQRAFISNTNFIKSTLCGNFFFK